MSAERTKVLVLGGTGMVGHTLFERLSERAELDVHATVRDVAPLAQRVDAERGAAIHPAIDVRRFDTVARVVDEVRPQVLINAIGIVKQVAGSRDAGTLVEVNALVPHRLAELCAETGIRLIHISTDCVFSGTKGNYTEDDPPDATDLYGRTKLLGEPRAGRALTLRTSVVGHELDSRHGLVEWFLSQEGSVPGFRRALFSGLPTVELARVLGQHVLPSPELSGLYHLASAPIAKLELLELIAGRYDKQIAIEARDEPAIDRSLDSGRFEAATGYQPPPWPQLVDAMFDDATVRYGSRFRAPAGR